MFLAKVAHRLLLTFLILSCSDRHCGGSCMYLHASLLMFTHTLFHSSQAPSPLCAAPAHARS